METLQSLHQTVEINQTTEYRQKIQQSQIAVPTLLHEKGYSAHCIPKTYEFALTKKNFILDKAPLPSRAWPFADNLLAWLVPEFKKNILEFHISNGPSLLQILTDEQVKVLDETMLQKLKLILMKMYTR